jgi:hypothetical protein
MSKPRKHLPCYHCGAHVEVGFDATRCTCAPCTAQGRTLPGRAEHNNTPSLNLGNNQNQQQS